MKTKHPTLDSKLSNADLCRFNNWTVGTILESKSQRIRITAIGEFEILAVALRHKPGVTWKRTDYYESQFHLVFSSWNAVGRKKKPPRSKQ